MNATTDRPVARLRMNAPEGNSVALSGLEWAAFWQQLRLRLLADGYRQNTLRVYRQILRDLRTFLRDRHGVVRPDGLTVQTAEGFLVYLSQKNVSWSWMASAIAVLRTAFDKLGGLNITARMVTPRRNWPLPETLMPFEGSLRATTSGRSRKPSATILSRRRCATRRAFRPRRPARLTQSRPS